MSYPINLEHLRKEAKTILKQCRAGNTASIERVRLQLPKLALLDTRGPVGLQNRSSSPTFSTRLRANAAIKTGPN